MYIYIYVYIYIQFNVAQWIIVIHISGMCSCCYYLEITLEVKIEMK